jgi:hypothetical protein
MAGQTFLALATNKNRDYRSCGSWLVKLSWQPIRTEITEVVVHGWSNFPGNQ